MKYHGILSHLTDETAYRAILTGRPGRFDRALIEARQYIPVEAQNGEGNIDSRREELAILIAGDLLDIDSEMAETFSEELMKRYCDFANYIAVVLTARDLTQQGFLVETQPFIFERVG
jgi:hypothetical protein